MFTSGVRLFLSVVLSFSICFSHAQSVLRGDRLTLKGSTSGLLTQKAAASTTTHTLTWPSAQGAAAQGIVNDGAGALTWSDLMTMRAVSDSSSTGADVDLSTTAPMTVLSNASLESIRSLAVSTIGSYGALAVLVNDKASGEIVIKDGTGVVASNRILTGSAADLSVPVGGAVTLVYDYLAGRWRVLSLNTGTSSSAGGTNEQREYISNGKAESSTTGWSTYADAAASTPADGTGGSPNVVLSRTTTGSEIIRETASFKLAKDAVNRQGEGVSYDFTVDPHDYANGMPVYVSFEYKTTANYASSDIVCSIRDLDAGAAITLFDSASLNGALPASTGGTKFTGRFYPSTSTSDDYRLICHIATTNASAYDFIFDSVHAGTANLIPGYMGTGWESWTPTGSWSTNTTYTGYKRRNGDVAEYVVKIATSGAPTSAALTINLPSAEVIDTAKLPGGAPSAGTYFFHSSGTTVDSGNRNSEVRASYNNTTSVALVAQNATNGGSAITQAVPFTFGASDYVEVYFSVPITNWASSASLSTAEALFSTVKVRYTTNTSNSMASGTTRVDFEDKDYDEFSAVTTGASWVFTAPKTGLYKVNTHNILASSAAWNAGEILYATLYKNGNASATLGYTMVEANGTLAKSVRGSASVLLNAGDTVDVRLTQNSGSAINLDGSAQNNYIEIEEDPRFNIFSTYGHFEVLTATSSTKTPSATNNYHSLTGNSLTLTKGTWKLTGKSSFSNSGSSPAYASIGMGFYGSNGGDSSSAPATGLSSVVTVLSAEFTGGNSFFSNVTGDNHTAYVPNLVVRCASSTCVIYVVSYATMTTAANARITVYANAERLQ